MNLENIRAMVQASSPFEMLENHIIAVSNKIMHRHGIASKEDRQEFHNAFHVAYLADRMHSVMKCLLGKYATLLARYESIGKWAAYMHDLVQGYKIGGCFLSTSDPPLQMRIRNRPQNEDETAEIAREILETYGYGVLQKEEIDAVVLGIQWTAPVFDETLKTVVQDRFRKALQEGNFLHPIAVALPICDLIPCGDKPNVFLNTADDLFREEQTDINQMLMGTNMDETTVITMVSPANQKRALEVMRKWDLSQVDFARGRKIAFHQEASSIGEIFGHDACDRLLDRFQRFDHSIEDALVRAKQREKLTFYQYARAMGW